MDMKAILRREVEGYARQGFNGYGVFLANDEAGEYSVIWHSQDGKAAPALMILAGIVDGKIHLYEDHTVPSLAETLIESGVAPEDIVSRLGQADLG